MLIAQIGSGNNDALIRLYFDNKKYWINKETG